MATPITPEQWLPVLAKMLDARYQGEDNLATPPSVTTNSKPGLAKLRRYARGKADLPEMGQNLKASWERFQQKARTDYGGIAVRSLRNRIRVNGLRIGEKGDNPALARARRIWRDNRLDQQVSQAIRDYLECGISYLVVSLGDDRKAVVTREAPEQFIAATDPLRPHHAIATLKVWRDPIAGLDHAQVVAAGAAQTFVRPTKTYTGSIHDSAAGDDWELDGDPVAIAGDPQVAILDRGDDGAYLAPHLDVIDRINLGKLQRLVTTAMQAFRQRALRTKDGSAGLSDTDENGNAIDWARAFEPAPGALWDLPEGIDIWESQQTDLQPMLEGEKVDARDFAAATGTPISVLIPDGQNQSAEGAAASKEQQVAQAGDDILYLKPVLAIAIVYALRAEGVDLGDDTVEVLFAPPEHVSLQEKYAAAAQAKALGLSQRTIKSDILGMSPDQIAQDETDAASDMLAQALLAVAQPSAPQTVVNNGPADGAAD